MKSKAKELRSQEGRGRAVLLGATPRLGLANPFLNLGERGDYQLGCSVWVEGGGSAIQRLSRDRSKPRLKVASLLGLLAPNIADRNIPKYIIWLKYEKMLLPNLARQYLAKL